MIWVSWGRRSQLLHTAGAETHVHAYTEWVFFFAKEPLRAHCWVMFEIWQIFCYVSLFFNSTKTCQRACECGCARRCTSGIYLELMLLNGRSSRRTIWGSEARSEAVLVQDKLLEYPQTKVDLISTTPCADVTFLCKGKSFPRWPILKLNSENKNFKNRQGLPYTVESLMVSLYSELIFPLISVDP